MILLKNPDWSDRPWRGVACGSQRRLRLRKLSGLQAAPLQAFRRRMLFQQNQGLSRFAGRFPRFKHPLRAGQNFDGGTHA